MPGRRIFIVDDDPDIVVYLTSLLEDHGYDVRAAPDAGTALAALETDRPDALLVDVLLPGRSGLDLLVSIRHDPRLRGVALVVITGMDEILQHDCQSYLASHQGVAGPDAVLGKPVEPRTLLAILAHLLGPRSPLSAGNSDRDGA